MKIISFLSFIFLFTFANSQTLYTVTESAGKKDSAYYVNNSVNYFGDYIKLGAIDKHNNNQHQNVYSLNRFIPPVGGNSEDQVILNVGEKYYFKDNNTICEYNPLTNRTKHLDSIGIISSAPIIEKPDGNIFYFKNDQLYEYNVSGNNHQLIKTFSNLTNPTFYDAIAINNDTLIATGLSGSNYKLFKYIISTDSYLEQNLGSTVPPRELLYNSTMSRIFLATPNTDFYTQMFDLNLTNISVTSVIGYNNPGTFTRGVQIGNRSFFPGKRTSGSYPGLIKVANNSSLTSQAFYDASGGGKYFVSDFKQYSNYIYSLRSDGALMKFDTITNSFSTAIVPTASLQFGNSATNINNLTLKGDSLLWWSSTNNLVYYCISSGICDTLFNKNTNSEGIWSVKYLSAHPNGKLYGTGINGLGSGSIRKFVLFEIDTINHAPVIKKAVLNTNSNGIPTSKLFLCSNGKFYGMGNGGISNKGAMYEYDPNLNTLNTIFSFSGSNITCSSADFTGNIDGRRFYMSEKTPGLFYGVWRQYIFKFDFGAGTVIVLKTISDYDNKIPAFQELSTLTGSKIYFTYRNTAGRGIFSGYDIVTNQIQKIDSLLMSNSSDSPFCSLLSYNGDLIGNKGDGDFTQGTLSNYNPTSNSYNTLHSYYSPFPTALIQSLSVNALLNNNILYGVTYFGGNTAGGNLYKYDLTLNQYTSLYDFVNTANVSGSSDLGYGVRDLACFGCSQSTIGIANSTETNSPISLFPNPFTNELSISINNLNNENYTLRIIDLLGKTLLREKDNTSEKQLNLAELSNGVYYLSIETNNGERVVKKIIKQ